MPRADTHTRTLGLRLIAVLLTTALALTLAAGSASAADPTPTSGATATAKAPAPTAEQRQQAATAAAKAFCDNAGVASVVLTSRPVKRACAAVVARLLSEKGRQVSAAMLCTRLTAPLGLGAPIAREVCLRVGGALVRAVVSHFDAALKTVMGAVKKVVAVVSFVKNASSPLDMLANATKEDSISLVNGVLPELSKATSFDPTAPWWLKRYAVGGGLGLLVMAVMMLLTIAQTARGDLSGQQLGAAVFKQAPMGFFLIMFAPLLAVLMTQLSNSLTEGLIRSAAPDMASFLHKVGVIFAPLTSAIPGGALMGLGLYGALFIGALSLFTGLQLQTLTLYLSGAVCAIAFGMWVNPAWRRKAARLPMTWLGILLAKPLLFFMLSVVIGLADFAASAESAAAGSFRALSTAMLAALGILIIGIAPFTLLKWAPLLPEGSDSSGRTSGGHATGAVASTAGQMVSNMALHRAHRTSQVDQRSSPGGGAPSATPEPAPGGTTATGSTPRPGVRATAATRPGQGGTGSTSSAPATTGRAGGAIGAGGAGSGTAATAGATAGVTAGKAGATVGAGAATGGSALPMIAAVETGKAAVKKAQDLVQDAAPDMSTRDGA